MYRNPKNEYNNTEAGMSERVRDELRGKIAYNETTRGWHLFNGYIWEPMGADELYNYVIENVVRTIPSEDWSRLERGASERERQESREHIARKQRELMLQWESRRKLAEVMKLTSSAMTAEFDHEKTLPFSNGVLTLDGKLRQYKPDDYFTACIPTAYVPDVSAFPAGEKFMDEITLTRPELVNSLFSIMGYCLLWGNPEQVFFVFKGGGGNGKGVLLDWLEAAFGGVIIGSINGRELRADNRDQRQTSLAACVSKTRMYICKEQGGGKLDDGIIKNLSGDKTINIKSIYKGDMKYTISGKLVMVTNQLPEFGDGGKAMQRRELAVPFDLDLPEAKQNPRLLDELTTPTGNEWLVSRVVRALLQYTTGGKPLREYLCREILEFTDKAFREQDIYFDYIKERLVREAGAKTLGSSVFYDFMEWRYGEMQDYVDSRAYEGRANTICRNPNMARDFYEGLKTNGIQIKDKERIDGCKNAQRHVLQGWRLRTDKDDEVAGQLEQYLQDVGCAAALTVSGVSGLNRGCVGHPDTDSKMF